MCPPCQPRHADGMGSVSPDGDHTDMVPSGVATSAAAAIPYGTRKSPGIGIAAMFGGRKPTRAASFPPNGGVRIRCPAVLSVGLCRDGVHHRMARLIPGSPQTAGNHQPWQNAAIGRALRAAMSAPVVAVHPSQVRLPPGDGAPPVRRHPVRRKPSPGSGHPRRYARSLCNGRKPPATRQIHQHRERRGDRGSQASTQAPPDPGQSSAAEKERRVVGLPWQRMRPPLTAAWVPTASGGPESLDHAGIHGMFCSPAAWKRIDAAAVRRDRGPVSRPGVPRRHSAFWDLFGIRARRSHREDSDYDILCTVPDDGGPVDVFFAMDAAQAAAMRADPAAEVNLQILSETAVEDAYFDTDFMRTAQRDMVDVGHLLEINGHSLLPSGP